MPDIWGERLTLDILKHVWMLNKASNLGREKLTLLESLEAEVSSLHDVVRSRLEALQRAESIKGRR